MSLQTKVDIFTNSADSDKTACNEPSHLDLHCLPLCFGFCADIPVFNNVRAKKIQRWKSQTQKARVESVKMNFYVSSSSAIIGVALITQIRMCVACVWPILK